MAVTTKEYLGNLGNVATPGLGARTFEVTGTGFLNLGNVSATAPGTKAIQIRANGSTISITVCKKLHGSAIADTAATVCNYVSAYADTTNVAGTAITADAFILVSSVYADVILNFGTNSGTCIIEVGDVAYA